MLYLYFLVWLVSLVRCGMMWHVNVAYNMGNILYGARLAQLARGVARVVILLHVYCKIKERSCFVDYDEEEYECVPIGILSCII